MTATVRDSTADDGYTKGDDVDEAREPGNGAIALLDGVDAELATRLDRSTT